MDDGEASAAGQATHVEKSAEGAAAGEAKSPGTGPTPPAAVSGLTSDTRAVGADAVGGEISSSRDQGLGPAVGERKRESVAGQDGWVRVGTSRSSGVGVACVSRESLKARPALVASC